MSTLNRIAVLSIAAGFAVMVALFVATFSAILLVGGDGTAPAFTHLVLRAMSVPGVMLGVSSPGVLWVGGPFWGAVAAICVFALLQVVQALR